MRIYTNSLVISRNKNKIYDYMNEFLNLNQEWSVTTIGDDLNLKTRSSRTHNELILNSVNKNIVLDHIKYLCKFVGISENLNTTLKYLVIYNLELMSAEQQYVLKAIIEKYSQFTIFILTTSKPVHIHSRLNSLLDIIRLEKYPIEENSTLLKNVSQFFYNIDHQNPYDFRDYVYMMMINNISIKDILYIIYDYYKNTYPNKKHQILREISKCDFFLANSERVIYHIEHLFFNLKHILT